MAPKIINVMTHDLTRDDYENSRAYNWLAVKKEEITCKLMTLC